LEEMQQTTQSEQPQSASTTNPKKRPAPSQSPSETLECGSPENSPNLSLPAPHLRNAPRSPRTGNRSVEKMEIPSWVNTPSFGIILDSLIFEFQFKQKIAIVTDQNINPLESRS
ncbi:12921_t:CDS:2, partial [Gigaspora rosea]